MAPGILKHICPPGEHGGALSKKGRQKDVFAIAKAYAPSVESRYAYRSVFRLAQKWKASALYSLKQESESLNSMNGVILQIHRPKKPQNPSREKR
jgi:hypothetical protein